MGVYPSEYQADTTMSTVKVNIILLITYLVLSACSKSESETDFATLSYDKTGSFKEEQYTHDQLIIVNAFQGQYPAEETLEAKCSIKGRGFIANFTSPKNVLMPVFGTSFQSVDIQCTYGGVTKRKSYETDDRTQLDIRLLTFVVESGPCNFAKLLYGICYSEDKKKKAAEDIVKLKGIAFSEHRFQYPYINPQFNLSFQ